MEIGQFLVIFTVGVVAGVINTLAGGGSLITLPVLIFLGLPATVANGTNRLAITVQSVLAVAGFKRKGVSNFKLSFLMSLPALIGAIIGAQLAVDVSDILFKRILAVVMILVLGLILWNPIRMRQGIAQCDGGMTSLSRSRRIASMLIFFFIGVYGGFFQAGVGFFFFCVFNTIN